MKLTPLKAALLVVLLLVVGFWSLNLWLFHSWLAGGPPTPHPERHLVWSYLFLVVGVTSLGGAGWVTWRRRVEVKQWLESVVEGI